MIEMMSSGAFETNRENPAREWAAASGRSEFSADDFFSRVATRSTRCNSGNAGRLHS